MPPKSKKKAVAAPLKTIGTRVRELREKRGWSQVVFAEKVGLDRTYISGIERGQRNLRILTLLAIAETFDVPLSHLLE